MWRKRPASGGTELDASGIESSEMAVDYAPSEPSRRPSGDSSEGQTIWAYTSEGPRPVHEVQHVFERRVIEPCESRRRPRRTLGWSRERRRPAGKRQGSRRCASPSRAGPTDDPDSDDPDGEHPLAARATAGVAA